MKRQVVMMSIVISVALAGTALAGSLQGSAVLLADSSMQGSTSGSTGSTGAVGAPADKHTDLTGGQPGIPNEYAGTPVAQGKLQEVTDSKWLQKPVHGMNGEVIGNIKQVLKDQKTGEIEYVIFVPNDSKTALPLRWSQFEERKGQLRLNMKNEDLKKVLNAPNNKDISPDLQEHMSQIEQARSRPKAGHSQEGSPTSSPAAGGVMGEDKASGGGVSGPQALPPGQAPGLEGNHPSSKR
jgi:sporulation protein YlmC with PRC-barrel domain